MHEAERARLWREFCEAAEDASRGDYKRATALCERFPSVRTELWAFAKALAEGRIVRAGAHRYRNVRTMS